MFCRKMGRILLPQRRKEALSATNPDQQSGKCDMGSKPGLQVLGDFDAVGTNSGCREFSLGCAASAFIDRMPDNRFCAIAPPR